MNRGHTPTNGVTSTPFRAFLKGYGDMGYTVLAAAQQRLNI
jgi:hypothetical protein